MKSVKTINLPEKSIKDLYLAMKLFETAQDNIEDYLLMEDKKNVSELRKARNEHLNAKFFSWKDLKNKYV